MSALHTPGPWSLLRWNVEITHSDEFMHEIHAGEHSAPVAMIPVQSSASTYGKDGSTDIGLAESLANARLVAAAPELLAALNAVLSFCRPQTGHEMDSYDAARAAIANAVQP